METILYKKLFIIVVKLFGLKVEFVELHKPMGAEFWGYSDTSDVVYEIYVTNSKGKRQNGLFGFWVHDETLLGVYKKAYNKTISSLKWAFNSRLVKWLR